MDFKVILEQQTPTVDNFVSVKSLIEEKHVELKAFLEFAKTQSTAVGLAANQVSLDGERFMYRVFALKNLFKDVDGSYCTDNTWRLIINPVINEKYGIKIEKSEGCLTWPDRKIISERHRFVKVSYSTVDEDFEEITNITDEEHEDFEAQIWQHEINHLNGFEEKVMGKDFRLHVKDPAQRNDACPCGSGKKYKSCCHSFVNPKVVYTRRESFDSKLAGGAKPVSLDSLVNKSKSIEITKQGEV
jgi:peptide deformylase